MSKDNEQPTKEELLTASRVYWKEKEKYVNGKRVLETMVYSFSFENHMNELKREREEAIESGFGGVKGMDEMVEEAREYARTDVKDVLFFISRASSFDDDGKMLRAYRVGIEPFIVSSSKA